MITVPTHKLFFSRFTNCVKFTIIQDRETGGSLRGNPAIRQIHAILKGSGCDFRKRIDWHFTPDRKIRGLYSVYLADDAVFDALLSSDLAEMITWVSKPASKLHKELLLSNTEIIIRDTLLYKRFRYKINFSCGWKRESYKELVYWLNNSFAEKKHGRKGEWLLQGRWSPSLFLVDESDLVLVKLSQSELIVSVTRVDLFTEHGITSSSMLNEPELS